MARRLDINTISGTLTLRSVTADIEISTTSGDIVATDLKRDVEIGTTSGDVSLRGITARTARVRTTSGEVEYEGPIDPAGRYELFSHSGDVGLVIPRETSAQLTVRTWSGGIESEFPITLKPGEHSIGSARSKSFTFEIGGGAGRISAETFSGDITIKSGGRGR